MTPAARVACCEVLLANGADIEARSGDGYTALHLALLNACDNVAAVRCLVERGADVRKPDPKDSYPIHLDRTSMILALFEVLLSHGADASVLNAQGQVLAEIVDELSDWEDEEDC